MQNVNFDSSQEGHLLIWGHFPAKNGCQSLNFKFPAKAMVVLTGLFCQLARQAVLPEFKIGMQKYLNFWQICHFEGLGSIWWGFVLSYLVLDWHFGTYGHIFKKSTFGIWGGVFFEVGAPLVETKFDWEDAFQIRGVPPSPSKAPEGSLSSSPSRPHSRRRPLRGS